MKTAVRSDLKSKAFCYSKSYTLPREKQTCLIDFKFYQKLFVVLISLSTILIFPENPGELENICINNHIKESCNVW